jgi:glycosyltransferase involved in cell wall biosynthesis
MRKGLPCRGPGPLKCLSCAADQYGAAIGPPVAALTLISGHFQRDAVDLLLPVSREVALRCRLARGRTPYEVIPNFLVDQTAPGDLIGPDGARLSGLPSGPFILYVGDLAADKGVGVLLRAHERMRERVPLVLIGRVVEPELLSDRADVMSLGMLSHETVLAAWARSTVGVVPSITGETFGLVALEAMAAGVPVVASRVGGLPEVVGESGILVGPGDSRELSVALDRLLGDSDLRGRLAAEGVRRAELFTADAIVPRVEQAYERARAIRERSRAA